MVYQIFGITGCINRESTSGRTICKLLLTNRGSLGVLDNPNKKILKKGLIRQEEVPYIGHVLSKDGSKPDPEKIHAVQEM